MTPIKRRLLYIFRDTLLRLRITWNRTDTLTLSVGYHIDRTDARGRSSWDGARCRKNTTHGKDQIPAAIINRQLEILEQQIDQAFYTFESQDLIPTRQQLKQALTPASASGQPAQRTITDIIDEFINEQSAIHQWSHKMMCDTRKSLLYLPEALGQDITLDQIDNTRYATLLQYFFQIPRVTTGPDGQRTQHNGLNNTTINHYLKHIRRFVRWAQQKQYCTAACSITEHHATLRTIRRPVIFLDWDELHAILTVDLAHIDTLSNVRDMFCLGCFTGLRFSDLTAIRWSDIHPDHINTITKKTSDPLTIDLNKFSRAIIDRLAARPHNDTDTLFHPISLQHYNHILTKIAQMAGIDAPIEIAQMSGSERTAVIVPKHQCITSHTARRTFVCNALSLGIPPNIVMKWTGHKNYKCMSPYIDVTSSARQRNMALFDTLPTPSSTHSPSLKSPSQKDE